MSQMKKQQNEEVKNVIIAMILVTIIMFTFNQFSTPKQTSETLQNEPVKISQVEQTNLNNVIPQSEVVVEKKADPVLLKNEFVEASFDPALGGFNKVALLKYKETLEADSKNISVLDNDYFTSLLWKSRDAQMPSKNSFWKEDETRSTSQKKVFVFQNEDVKIEREVTLDNQYMVVIKDTITNLMQMPIKTYQEGFISRKMETNPPVSTVHQGFVGYLNDYLVEEKYDTDEKIYSDRTKDGWFGFTDKYWQTLMVLNPNENVSVSFSTMLN